MAYAVKLSREQAFEGRLGLHAADDVALAFYRHLHDKIPCGLFYPERTGVSGPTPHSGRNDPSLTYLVTTVVGAQHLLEDYRRV